MCKAVIALALFAGLLSAKTATLEGRQVYYEVSGTGARTIVLVHGWTCDHTFWQAQVLALSKKYRVIALDLPGHGKSQLAPAYPMSLFAHAIDAVMRAEGVSKATLVGHSMGGAVLLEFSRLYPAKLEAAVLVDSFMADPATLQSPAKFIETMQGEKGLEARRKMVEGMFSPATPPVTREHILKVMLGTPETVAVDAMRQMFSQETWRPGKSDVPAFAMVANTQRITEASLKARWPNLIYRSMAATGHFLMMEKPDEFNTILLTWLSAQ